MQYIRRDHETSSTGEAVRIIRDFGPRKRGRVRMRSIKGKDPYLPHVLRKRMEYPELKRAVCE